MYIKGKIGKITRLVFDQSFTPEYCDEFINFIVNKYEPYLKNKPIGKHELRIIIESHGGDCRSGFNMIKYFLDISNKYNVVIKTYIMKVAYSMGSALFMIGHERYVQEESFIGFHVVQSGTYGKLQEMHADIERSNRYFDEMIKLFSLRMGKKWAENMKQLIYNGREHTIYGNDMVEQKIATGFYAPLDF